jgi:hypothetical protein
MKLSIFSIAPGATGGDLGFLLTTTLKGVELLMRYKPRFLLASFRPIGFGGKLCL